MNVGKVVWVEVGNDIVGIMPCGLTVAVVYVSRGMKVGGYNVRFGVSDHPETFWGIERAKHEGIVLAAHILRSCLEACEAEIEDWDREQAKQRPQRDDQP